MKATAIRQLILWYDITECDIFSAAYTWKYGEDICATGMLPLPLSEAVLSFFTEGIVPHFVEEYLKKVIFPRFIKSNRNVTGKPL